jgi:glycosyltransferase involved in cell wall biosynthesis
MGVISQNLSIVTCSKSDEVGLTKTLDSLRTLESDFPQVILVLSQYSTPQIEKLRNKYSDLNINIIQVEAEGIYVAQNRGLQAAKSKFTLVLNGGDCIASESALRDLLINTENSQWGYGSLEIIDPLSGAKSIYKFNNYSLILHRLGLKFVPHPATIVRTETAKKNGGFDKKFQIAADQKMLLNFASKYKPVTTNRVVTIFYRGGESSRTPEKIVSDFSAISRELFGYFFKSRLIDNVIWKIVLVIRRFKSSN